MHSLLLRPHGVDAIGELLRLLKVRKLGFHPNKVRKRRIGNSPVDSAFRSALVAVVALARAGRIPIPVDVDASQFPGDGTSLAVALSIDSLAVLLDEGSLVLEGTGVDGIHHSVIESLQTRLGDPLILDGLEFVARLAGLLRSNHQVIERRQVRVGGTDDELVVSVVDGRGDERGGFRVGSSNSDEVGAF